MLVGSLQLRSLSDAGADIAEAIEADAGINLQARAAEGAAEGAARRANDKSEQKDQDRDNGHNDKGGGR